MTWCTAILTTIPLKLLHKTNDESEDINQIEFNEHQLLL